jgi:hypothetical protein
MLRTLRGMSQIPSVSHVVFPVRFDYPIIINVCRQPSVTEHTCSSVAVLYSVAYFPPVQ